MSLSQLPSCCRVSLWVHSPHRSFNSPLSCIHLPLSRSTFMGSFSPICGCDPSLRHGRHVPGRMSRGHTSQSHGDTVLTRLVAHASGEHQDSLQSKDPSSVGAMPYKVGWLFHGLGRAWIQMDCMLVRMCLSLQACCRFLMRKNPFKCGAIFCVAHPIQGTGKVSGCLTASSPRPMH